MEEMMNRSTCLAFVVSNVVVTNDNVNHINVNHINLLSLLYIFATNPKYMSPDPYA